MTHILYFIRNLYSYSGRILYLNLIGMILISLLEGIGILLLIPLISFTGVLDFNSEVDSPITWISNIFEPIPQDMSLALVLGIYVILIIGQSFFQRRQMIFNTRIQQGYLRHLREETYKGLMQADWGFFLRNRKSDIINIMTTEVVKVSGGTNMFLNFIASLVFTFIQVSFAFWLSGKMTIAVLIFGFALIFLSRKLIKRSTKIGEETVQLSRIFLAGISDHINGIKDIKSNTLEESNLKWIHSFGQRFEKNVIELIILKTKSQFIFKVTSALLMAGFVFFSVKMFQAQPAQVMLIIVIFTRLWPRLSGIQSNLEQIGEIIPSFKYLTSIQKECLQARELNEKTYMEIQPIHIKKGLECQNVYFRYNLNEPKNTLQDINVQVPANKMTAIVGRSGAGKSTLIDLFMGLNQPEKGQVLVDGVTLTDENLLSLRRSISYVPQDPFLFNSTIRENLLLIQPNATEKEIWEALEFAAADFVKKLPQGLETLIGDRGIKLSGGERQRLVLARAILRKPSILILDEATSALDTENETKIQESLERLNGKMTIIVIAHRLSTIKNADQVVVLDKGEIIQRGEFGQLAREENGMFNSLLGKQMETAL